MRSVGLRDEARHCLISIVTEGETPSDRNSLAAPGKPAMQYRLTTPECRDPVLDTLRQNSLGKTFVSRQGKAALIIGFERV